MLKAVTVNFNTGERLTECVRVLLSEPLIGEVVVVDNASSDDSLAMLEALRPTATALQIIRNDENKGFASAVNSGIATDHETDWLVVNPDCMFEAGSIQELRNALHANPDAGMAGPLIVNPDGTEQRGCRRNLPDLASSISRTLGASGFDLTGTLLPDKPTPVPAISGACMVVRADALADVGLLDEHYFLHCEDLDWCRRFGEVGWQVLFVPAARVIHHQGTSSKGRPVRVLWHKHRGMWHYHCKFDAAEIAPLMNSLIFVGIHLRFGLLASLALGRRLLGK